MKNVTQFSPSGRRLLTPVKQPIETYATSNVDLISPPAVINGRTLVTEDRVLLTTQSDADENGLYGFDGTELQRAPDWLNEEGQLLEVLTGNFKGRLLAFVGGLWTVIGGGASSIVVESTVAAARADVALSVAHPNVYVVGRGSFVWVPGGSVTLDTGTETSTYFALSGDATGVYRLDTTPQFPLRPTARAISFVNVDLASLPATIGGATLVDGARYVLAGQSAPAENGTYQYDAAPTPRLVQTFDFTNAQGALQYISAGTYEGLTFARGTSYWTPYIGPGPMYFASCQAVRDASTNLHALANGPPPCIYVKGRGTFIWTTGVSSLQYSDTTTEYTSVIATTYANDSGYVQATADVFALRTAIGTGAAWVSLQTLSLSDLVNGDSRDVSYIVRGRYSADFISYSFIRGRGLAVITQSNGNRVIAAIATTFSDPRIQVVISGTDLLVQAQQHATENWVFESEVEVVTTKKFGGI